MFSNPIGWVQMQILGGLRKQAIIVGVYSFFAVTVLILFYRASIDHRPLALQQFAANAMIPATMVLLGILFFGASHAIKKAIQRDFTSNMITSHRNTAITGTSAAWGYLTGAPGQVYLLTAANIAICQALAILGSPTVSLAVPMAMMIVFACPLLMLLTLDILVGLSSRGAMVVTPFVVIFNFLGALQLMDICPGLALLMTTMSGGHVMNGITPDFIAQRFVAMLAQLTLALTFFLAAARKFQRDDVPAFNETLAFCLLALATLIGAVGIGMYIDGPRHFGPPVLGSRPAQIVSTVIPLALVAMLPVAHAARRKTDWLRRRRKDAEFAARTHKAPRGFFETSFAATAVVFGILAACSQWVIADRTDIVWRDLGVPAIVWGIAAFLLAQVTAGGIFHTTYSAAPKAGWSFVLLIIVTWVMPLLAEFGWVQFSGEAPTEGWEFSFLFGCSPVGTWILAFTETKGPIALGMGVQLLVAVCACLLARRSKP